MNAMNNIQNGRASIDSNSGSVKTNIHIPFNSPFPDSIDTSDIMVFVTPRYGGSITKKIFALSVSGITNDGFYINVQQTNSSTSGWNTAGIVQWLAFSNT